MEDIVPPSKIAFTEAAQLSEDILRDIELSQIPLYSVALKASRLARLCNDFDYQKIFEYESSGYPYQKGGIEPDVWRLAKIAGRVYEEKYEGKDVERAYCYSIESIESSIKTLELSLDVARDPNVSISSANPSQFVSPSSNILERNRIRADISQASSRLSARRAFIYSYVKTKYYELKFSGIADDIFSRIRETFDRSIGEFIPDSVQKMSAIYSNLLTNNPEDWSNAVHGCRRVLQDLADKLYPACADKSFEENGKIRTIKMGTDNYINRLIAFIEDNADSDRYKSIVGSNLRFIGERLDAVFQAAQKGSHSTIQERSEADRYVIYTYMIVGDILLLTKNEPLKPSTSFGEAGAKTQ